MAFNKDAIYKSVNYLTAHKDEFYPGNWLTNVAGMVCRANGLDPDAIFEQSEYVDKHLRWDDVRREMKHILRVSGRESHVLLQHAIDGVPVTADDVLATFGLMLKSEIVSLVKHNPNYLQLRFAGNGPLRNGRRFPGGVWYVADRHDNDLSPLIHMECYHGKDFNILYAPEYGIENPSETTSRLMKNVEAAIQAQWDGDLFKNKTITHSTRHDPHHTVADSGI